MSNDIDGWLEMAYEDRTHQDYDEDEISYFYGQSDGVDHSDDCCGECDICGEPYCTNDRRPSVCEVGEFVRIKEDGSTEHVIAHAQCGLDNEMELA